MPNSLFKDLLDPFLQTDPIGSKDDLDLYAYTGDDPVNGSDPTGTMFDDVADGDCIRCGTIEVNPDSADRVSAPTADRGTPQLNAKTSNKNGDPSTMGRSGCEGGFCDPAPIYGKPQVVNGDKESIKHDEAIESYARAAARFKEVRAVYLNMSLKTASGGKIDSNLRPDITLEMADGKFNPTEILSGNQVPGYEIGKYSGVKSDFMNPPSSLTRAQAMDWADLWNSEAQGHGGGD